MAYQVLIIEDSLITRKFLEFCIGESSAYSLVASVSFENYTKSLIKNKRIDLVLMGALTKCGEKSFSTAKELRQKNTKIKIILLSALPAMSLLLTAKEMGINSFCFTEMNGDKIISVMNKTVAGESVYPVCLPNVSVGLAQSQEFTVREKEVLRELLTGDTNVEIAKRLNVTPETVKYHICQMLQKTGFQTRTELAVEARTAGIVIK